MKKSKIMTLLVIGIFLLSVNGHVSTISGQQGGIQTNFEVLLTTNAGNRLRESYAFYVKQALAPLGIEVDVLAKPFGQFVGDLLHLSTGQPYGLAIVAITGCCQPSFFQTLRSNSFFGSFTWQLTDPDWQAWMEQDIGVTTEEVDQLIIDMEFELDPLKKLEIVNEFAQLFMTDLHYYVPLVEGIIREAGWAGYGGPNNELYDILQGVVGSQRLGAKWVSNPAARVDNGVNDTTVQLRTGDAAQKGMFDAYQVADVPTGQQIDSLISNLLSFDSTSFPHPELAVQWFIEDRETLNGTLDFFDDDGNPRTRTGDLLVKKFLEGSRHTFVLNTNFSFSPTTDHEGNPIGPHNIDANDVKTTLDYLMNYQSNNRGTFVREQVANYSVSTTVVQDDTITIDLYQTGLEDFALTGAVLTALPEHILGGTLTLENGTQFTVADKTHVPENSVEWQHWTSQEGNTYSGPYRLAEMDHPNGFWSFAARDDYQFVNEKTTTDYYNAHKAAFDAAFADVNMTGWGGDLSTFAPHYALLNDEPYFWAYDGFDETLNVQSIIYKVISDDNAALLAFEAGQLDFLTSSSLGAATVAAHEASDDFRIKDQIGTGLPTFMAFDLTNEHLKKRDVRMAIHSVIDKEELTQVNDGFGIATHSPVSPGMNQFPLPEFAGAGPNGEDLQWYNEFPVPFSYEAARDLMRENGYTAQESNQLDEQAQEPPVRNVISTVSGALGADLWIGFSAFAITSVVLIRRVRKFK